MAGSSIVNAFGVSGIPPNIMTPKGFAWLIFAAADGSSGFGTISDLSSIANLTSSSFGAYLKIKVSRFLKTQDSVHNFEKCKRKMIF